MNRKDKNKAKNHVRFFAFFLVSISFLTLWYTLRLNALFQTDNVGFSFFGFKVDGVIILFG